MKLLSELAEIAKAMISSPVQPSAIPKSDTAKDLLQSDKSDLAEEEPGFPVPPAVISEVESLEFNSYSLHISVDGVERPSSYHCSLSDWNDIYLKDRVHLICDTINKQNYVDGSDLDYKVVSLWLDTAEPKDVPGYLWLFGLKHDNYFTLEGYERNLLRIQKGAITCKFKDLKERNQILN